MTKTRKIALFAAIAVLTAGVALIYSQRTHTTDQLVAMGPAPAWKLMDLDGREVSSAQFQGKVVVLDFWATWCGPCISEIPGYVELQKKYGPAGLAIVGVSLDTIDPDRVKKFAQANAINYTLVVGDDAVVEAFGSFESIPTTFLINRSGQIVHHKTGAYPPEEYEKLVQQALN